MQVSGSDLPHGLLLDSGGEKVPISDGAGLHLFPTRNKRLIFSVTGPDDKSLCEWGAKVATSRFDPPFVSEGFGSRSSISTHTRTFQWRVFRKAEDPILLQVGGRLATESAEFSIDGLPAPVLARNAGQVILQDSHPAAGMRTIESRGYSISIPLVVIEMSLRNSSSPGPTSIEIRLLGRDRISLPPLRSRRLAIQNLDPGRVRILCGKSSHGGPTYIQLDGNESTLRASCRVILLKPGPVRIDAWLIESAISSRWRPRTPLPWPSGPPPFPTAPLTSHLAGTYSSGADQRGVQFEQAVGGMRVESETWRCRGPRPR
jgi:hypothetical protein